MTDKNEIEKYIIFINDVTSNPVLFNVNNVEDLYLILYGYLVGSSLDKELSDYINKIMVKFTHFVNKEFDCSSDFDWARVIRFYSGGDGHSLKLFKIKFDKFWVMYQER